MASSKSCLKSLLFIAILITTTMPISILAANTELTPEQKARTQAADEKLQQVIVDLLGADADRASAAMAEMKNGLLNKPCDFNAWRALDAMMAARKFAEVEAICRELIVPDANVPSAIASLQQRLARALLDDGKFDEALVAAKGYYNVAMLSDTKNAIEILAACLDKARPEEPAIRTRFKLQQIAAASATTQPTPPDANGAPILPTIKVDSKLYAADIDAIDLNAGATYASYVRKGNLLLLADRSTEAKKIFEEALKSATGNMGPSIENVARAIRAETGSVGAVNAYIISLRQQTPAVR